MLIIKKFIFKLIIKIQTITPEKKEILFKCSHLLDWVCLVNFKSSSAFIFFYLFEFLFGRNSSAFSFVCVCVGFFHKRNYDEL